MSAVRHISLVLYGQAVDPIQVAAGSTISWDLQLNNPNEADEPLDLTGCAVIQSLCSFDGQRPVQPPVIAREADITIPATDGACISTWVDGDTVIDGEPLTPGFYFMDVWTTDGDGNRLQNMGGGKVQIMAVGVLPDTEITPLPSQNPLALGQGFTYRRSYGNGTSYAPYDVVSYTSGDGSTSVYVCILATTGHAPTNATYWSLWASGAVGSLSDADPEDVGATASPGTSTEASRSDHVHAGGVSRLDEIQPGTKEVNVSLSIADSTTAGADGAIFELKGAAGASGGGSGPTPVGGAGTQFKRTAGAGADATSSVGAGTGGSFLDQGGTGGAASSTKAGGPGGGSIWTSGTGGLGSATQASGAGGDMSFDAGDPGKDNGGGVGAEGLLGLGTNTGDAKLGRAGARVQWLDQTAVKNSAYDAQPNELVLGNPTGGTFGVTLPDAAGRPCVVAFKNVSTSANPVTFTAFVGGQTVDGLSEFAVASPRAFVQFVNDGTSDWMVM